MNHAGTKQPLFSPDDCDLAEKLVKESDEIAKLVQERYGNTDIEKQLVCDPWSVHVAEYTGVRSAFLENKTVLSFGTCSLRSICYCRELCCVPLYIWLQGKQRTMKLRVLSMLYSPVMTATQVAQKGKESNVVGLHS